MKRNMKLIGLAACLISCTSLAVAQENPEPQERQQHEQCLPREVPNPEKIATQMTDQMQESLQLTEKQYKKIYKLNLKEQKEHFKAMQNSGEQRPPMGGPGMRGARRWVAANLQ
jgi:Spy/CpxP family protein refolding chaperone